MSCVHELANEWACCSTKNAGYNYNKCNLVLVNLVINDCLVIFHPWCKQLHFKYFKLTCTKYSCHLLKKCYHAVFQIFELVHQCVLSEIGIPGHECC